LALNLYEAMFLVDAARGGSRLPETIRHIAGLLKRHGCEIERMEKWDERKLAYPIKRTKRGIYILVYFRCEPSEISELRETIRLSETVVRVLIVKPEHVPPPQGELYGPDGEELKADQPPADEQSPAPGQTERVSVATEAKKAEQ